LGHAGWKEEARSGVKMSESTVVQPPVSEWQDLPWEMIRRRVWKAPKVHLPSRHTVIDGSANRDRGRYLLTQAIQRGAV